MQGVLLHALNAVLCAFFVFIKSKYCTVLSTTLDQHEYCVKQKQLCHHTDYNEHVVCKYQGSIGAGCFGLSMKSLKEIDESAILMQINKYRTEVARGQSRLKLPRGYGLWQVFWDSDLAAMALIMVRQCEAIHLCAATDKIKDPIACLLKTNDEVMPVDKNVFMAIHEHLQAIDVDLSTDEILRSPNLKKTWRFAPDSKFYLMMLVGELRYVGCAASMYVTDITAAEETLICYFSHYPNPGTPVYNTTKPKPGTKYTRSGCAPHSTETTENLCVESYTPSADAEDSTTNKYPDDSVNDEHPEESTTNEYPDDSGTNEYPEDSITNEYPEDSTTNKYPEDSTTNKYPEDSTTNQYPKDSTTNKYPEDSTTNKYPDVSRTNEYPKDSTTNKYSEDSTTNQYPEDSTTAKDPDDSGTSKAKNNGGNILSTKPYISDEDLYNKYVSKKYDEFLAAREVYPQKGIEKLKASVWKPPITYFTNIPQVSKIPRPWSARLWKQKPIYFTDMPRVYKIPKDLPYEVTLKLRPTIQRNNLRLDLQQALGQLKGSRPTPIPKTAARTPSNCKTGVSCPPPRIVMLPVFSLQNVNKPGCERGLGNNRRFGNTSLVQTTPDDDFSFDEDDEIPQNLTLLRSKLLRTIRKMRKNELLDFFSQEQNLKPVHQLKDTTYRSQNILEPVEPKLEASERKLEFIKHILEPNLQVTGTTMIPRVRVHDYYNGQAKKRVMTLLDQIEQRVRTARLSSREFVQFDTKMRKVYETLMSTRGAL